MAEVGVLGDGGEGRATEVREAKGRKPSATLKTSRIDAATTRFNHAAFSVFTRFLLLVFKTSFVYRATSSLLTTQAPPAHTGIAPHHLRVELELPLSECLCVDVDMDMEKDMDMDMDMDRDMDGYRWM